MTRTFVTRRTEQETNVHILFVAFTLQSLYLPAHNYIVIGKNVGISCNLGRKFYMQLHLTLSLQLIGCLYVKSRLIIQR